MQTIDLVILGASSFPEISEIIHDVNASGSNDVNYRVRAILDDNPDVRQSQVEGVPVCGALAKWEEFADAKFVMGIGSYRTRVVRYEILKRLSIPRERFATLVHPSAKIYRSASIGHGCIVWPGAVVFNGSRLDDFVLVLANSVVGAHNHICEGAMLTSLVATTANVTIGPYCHIGTATAISENVKIGPCTQIMMGSVVTRDIAPGSVCGGRPCRTIETRDVPQALLEAWTPMPGSDA